MIYLHRKEQGELQSIAFVCQYRQFNNLCVLVFKLDETTALLSVSPWYFDSSYYCVSIVDKQELALKVQLGIRREKFPADTMSYLHTKFHDNWISSFRGVAMTRFWDGRCDCAPRPAFAFGDAGISIYISCPLCHFVFLPMLFFFPIFFSFHFIRKISPHPLYSVLNIKNVL